MLCRNRGLSYQTVRNPVFAGPTIKWHAILVTKDGGSESQPGGILGNREELYRQFGVLIYRPEEAVECIRSKVTERDEFNAQVAALTGQPAPGWTGQD